MFLQGCMIGKYTVHVVNITNMHAMAISRVHQRFKSARSTPGSLPERCCKRRLIGLSKCVQQDAHQMRVR